MGNFAKNLNLGKRVLPPVMFELLHLFVALPEVAHFPKGIRLKSFPYKTRAIFCI